MNEFLSQLTLFNSKHLLNKMYNLLNPKSKLYGEIFWGKMTLKLTFGNQNPTSFIGLLKLLLLKVFIGLNYTRVTRL